MDGWMDGQVDRQTDTTDKQALVPCERNPPYFSAGKQVRQLAPLFDPSYQPSFQCPSSFYSRGSECLPCPDKSTSDAGAKALAECHGFSTIILAIKDPSVSFSARTHSSFGGAPDAQPNGFDIMNYTGMEQTASLYTGVRGYGVQATSLLDPRFPELGLETQACFLGSNCFNSSSFRERVSAALGGHVQPNEVRVLPPQDCSAPENAVADYCGLWPRYARHDRSNECVCSRPDFVPQPPTLPGQEYKDGQKCFWTLGAPYIGLDIGLKVDSNDQEEIQSQRGATVGDCADWCAETAMCHAFLYHHERWYELN
jgi:hypothetical protein